ncbi:MAG: L-histidine N(alpha)-methyltransferase, partial [Draconibacterium sp.]|nr:L-histidine N(alpha)-methyltransferase [Draconibacterium sp.]
MNFEEVGILQKNRATIKNLLPEIGIEQARAEIINGLVSEKPFISSKFFYDEKGSQLFEEITKLEEYYPTLTEKKILREIAPELMNRNSSFEIIELGSGDCSKISILLDAVENQNLENLRYIPVDFSKSAIEDSANELAERFPNLEINGYVADFTNQIGLVPHSEKPRIICFLGSTIGNFSKKESIDILINLSKGLLPGDSLLVGFDMIKDERILYSAYNDAKGITAKFNKNILNVVNHIMKTNFDSEDFEHLSFFNKEKLRIEMHLLANRDCLITSQL